MSGAGGGPSEAREPAWAALPDLASRRLGGSVVHATDELFAAKENLIKPELPVFAAGEFGARGKIYDGWESQRRREPGHDYAILRLGAPGVVHGVDVSTSFFRGNYPPQVSVEAISVDGYPSVAELLGLDWRPLAGRSPVRGDSGHNWCPAIEPRHCTHVRLSIYPDGGVARFRVHGQPLPDPVFLTGTVDLAAIDNGGQLIECSNAFYSSAWNLIMPGRPASMADGWENARRRDGGFDFATFGLVAAGVVSQVEIDTTCFVGNAPGSARLLAGARQPPHPASPDPASPDAGSPDATSPDAASPEAEDPDRGGPDAAPTGQWTELLPRVRLQPDTRHRFVVGSREPVAYVRLEVFPDGGLARLRVLGELTPDAMTELRAHYRAIRRPDA